MRRTRIVFLAIIGVALAIVAVSLLTGSGMDRVTGLVGSEKAPFFEDPRVQKALRRHGLEVTAQKAGSREIATSFDLSQYDFVFPAGAPAAEKIQRETGKGNAATPFFTPMAIASWKPIADLFVQQGIAQDQGGYYTVDMDALLPLVQDDVRWKDIPNNTAFPANKSVLITTTDVRKSNSAAMYLALMSYVANDDNVVQSMQEAQPLLPLLTNMFLRQGLRPSSSQEPFEDYLVKGMGLSPAVMIYEAQFVAQAARGDGSIQPGMVLLGLNEGKQLNEPLVIIYPKEGIVMADYPLMLLDSGKREAYDRLAAFIRSPEFQEKLMQTTLRRPVVPGIRLDPRIPDPLLIELPFPNTADVIDALLFSYLDEQRRPSTTFFVLDVSGSMEGDGLQDLKTALANLTGLDQSLTGQFARFRSREQIALLPFSTEVLDAGQFGVSSTLAQGEDMQRIRAYVEQLQAGGNTAIYAALAEAYSRAQAAQAQDPDRFYSIVLMSDGQTNSGLSEAEFRSIFQRLPAPAQQIKTFTVLFGDADKAEMQKVADLTGGRMFDAKSQSLSQIFKEIRGYQ